MEGLIPKKELRAAMRRQNLNLTSAQRASASEIIFQKVACSDDFLAARCVALFCSLPDEPATDAALARWRDSKRLVVPRVEGEVMRFYDYNAAGLHPGAFGIPEPIVTQYALLPDTGVAQTATVCAIPATCPPCASAAGLCNPNDIDLVIVPGVAFSPDGSRVGRGKGYYDRYLSQSGFRAVKIGVCYAHQLVAALPVEPHDVFMDLVISNN